MKQFRLLLLLALLMTAVTGAWAQSTTHVVNQDNVNTIFSGDGYTLGDGVTAGDVLDFQGTIDLGEETSHSLIVNKQVTIKSSTKDAVVMLHTVSGSLLGEDPGNSFVINKAASGSTIEDIKLYNTQTWIYNTSNVTFTGVTFHVEEARVGSGVGHVALRYSDHVTFSGCTVYTKNNGGSAAFVLTGSSYCTIDNCTILSEGNVGSPLNLGNVFNDQDKPEGFPTENNQVVSHHNTVKNCTLTKAEGNAFAIMCGGKCGLVEGNTINNGSLSTVFGATQPANADEGWTYRNNTITNGLTPLNYSTVENNTVGGSISCSQGSLVKGNNCNSLSGSGAGATIQNNIVTTTNSLSFSGNNQTISGNEFAGNVTLSGNNQTFTGNTMSNGNLTVTKKGATITDNTIITTGDFAIELKSAADDANNKVQNNVLIAATNKGDAAVKSTSESNIISGNYTAYKVKMKEGVTDADKWTITPEEATTDGVREGSTVTLQYNGRLKVKGVKATSDAAQ